MKTHCADFGRRRQIKQSAATSSAQITKDCADILKVTSPSGQERRAANSISSIKPATSSAAYLDHFINKEKRHQEKLIVDALMAAVSECIKKKLDAYAEGDIQSSESSSSSSASRAKKQPKSAGQKRQRRQVGRDDSEDDDGEEGFKKNKDNKKIKTANDDNRPYYACPFHQFNPQRFKNQRSCCGPGWRDLTRLK